MRLNKAGNKGQYQCDRCGEKAKGVYTGDVRYEHLCSHCRDKRKDKTIRFQSATRRLFKMIAHKPRRGYWTEKRCSRKMQMEPVFVLRVIEYLCKKGKLKQKDGYLVVSK